MDWLNKFAKTSHVLENWMIVQNLWMYLEAVFIGGDIAKQLPLETKRFTVIHSLRRFHVELSTMSCCRRSLE